MPGMNVPLCGSELSRFSAVSMRRVPWSKKPEASHIKLTARSIPDRLFLTRSFTQARRHLTRARNRIYTDDRLRRDCFPLRLAPRSFLGSNNTQMAKLALEISFGYVALSFACGALWIALIEFFRARPAHSEAPYGRATSYDKNSVQRRPPDRSLV